MDVDRLLAGFFRQFIFQRPQPEEPGCDLAHGPEVPVEAVGPVAFQVLVYEPGEAFHSIEKDGLRYLKRLIDLPGLAAGGQHESEHLHPGSA